MIEILTGSKGRFLVRKSSQVRTILAQHILEIHNVFVKGCLVSKRYLGRNLQKKKVFPLKYVILSSQIVLSFVDRSGGSRGAHPLPATNFFLNFLQFWGKFNKIISGRQHPPPPRKSWIRHWKATCKTISGNKTVGIV